MIENDDYVSPLPPRGSPTGSPTPGTWSPARRRTSPSSQFPLRVQTHISWSPWMFNSLKNMHSLSDFIEDGYLLSYLLCKRNSLPCYIVLWWYISNNLLIWSKKCFQRVTSNTENFLSQMSNLSLLNVTQWTICTSKLVTIGIGNS